MSFTTCQILRWNDSTSCTVLIPPVQRVVVDFKWAGENPAGVFKQVEGRRAVVRSEGIKCEDIYTGYMDVKGELNTYTRNPRVENEMVTYAGITFDPGVDTQETPRTCLDNSAAAGFKMRPDLGCAGYTMSITGVVIPTPAELATMKLPRELLEEEHMRLYAYQEFMLTTAEMRADGEDLADDHHLESLPVEMVYPELCAQWEERVEQATLWKEKASRRWKRCGCVMSFVFGFCFCGSRSVYVLLQFKRVSVKSVPFCVAFVRRVSEPAVPRMSEDA